METADFRGKAGRTQTHARRCSAFPRGAGRIGCAAPRGAVSAGAGPCCPAGSCRRGRHNLRCRGSHLSPFRRGSTGSVLLRHMMPWSLHFTARKRKVAKKRGRRPGEKSLSPGRRSAQPVIPSQRISGLNISAAFRRDNTGCGTRPGVRSPDGASGAATGIFLMAGVIKPLALRAASTVCRRKNKKAAHTVRPAPTPGPLTPALTFPIHFDDRIKRITRLRTSTIRSSESAPPDNGSSSSKDGFPKGSRHDRTVCVLPPTKYVGLLRLT